MCVKPIKAVSGLMAVKAEEVAFLRLDNRLCPDRIIKKKRAL